MPLRVTFDSMLYVCEEAGLNPRRIYLALVITVQQGIVNGEGNHPGS